jgi:hypothetical protein
MRLSNDYNVYILGAGFSWARGLPLVTDFMAALRDAHEWLLSNARATEAQSVEKVLEFRLQSTRSAYRVKVDLENIEELFSLAATQDESLTDHICIAIGATLDFCSSRKREPRIHFTLEHGGFDPPAVLTAVVKHPAATVNARQYEASAYDFTVAGLLGALEPKREATGNAFITFNYDLLLENSLTALKIPFSYGLGSKPILKHPTLSALSFSSGADLQVLKLHGSVNWATPNSPSQDLTLFGSYAPVHESAYAPALVPPTWRKSFSGNLANVWQQALDQIGRATRLVVIGFSMPASDQHFKFLLAAGLRENVSLREIVFVDPGREAIEARAMQLFGDTARRPSIRFVPAAAERFVGAGDLAGNSSSIGRAVHPAFQSIYPAP